MKKYLEIIKKSKLFYKISERDIEAMLSGHETAVRSYLRGEYIFRRGQQINSAAVVLCGFVQIESEDYWGNLSILSKVGRGELFGEAYACLKNSAISVSAVAETDAVILFVGIDEITSAQNPLHVQLTLNLLTVLAEKNRVLAQKIEHMSRRSIREKLLSYLSEQSQAHGSPVFLIDFNRQQLADFLSVDRSALSRELCRMRSEGILDFHKNRFELK
ncbi:MAG TPA: Crp/Fnr family transcriptional regulator [Candidatus Monoglobus merdigallinarum]|uniref:Crp/Fnr family transcriptional regulator n=1 Tax=Candidatus Monoglobus merdigallinarum TaxID=2838698 RepID=A0A9D1PRS1_9FIRM|nr:Crp/Fnr family transcriptional regulator [Candidatus Monoglobus merdigallinarum]